MDERVFLLFAIIIQSILINESQFALNGREEGNREARSKPVYSQEKGRREQRSLIRARLLTREEKKGTEKPDQSPFTHKRREEGNREARSEPVCSQEKGRREQRSPIRALLLTRGAIR
ncbi:hypothetical protein P4571_05320 [Niallia alba]|uniref:hypothetical protein n=1 Tax=Niallia alba TaxID=2729105 RepID=UPI002E2078E3|nr:hypothetical protein [Niallia alba]